jgi:Saxitoxin biosynthesis operon protein SxtJ
MRARDIHPLKTLAVLCAGLALIAWWRHQIVLLYLATGLGLLGLVSTRALTAITGAWLWLGEQMGAISSRVILTVIFFGILTPLALLYRITRRKEPIKASYFTETDHLYSPSDMERAY